MDPKTKAQKVLGDLNYDFHEFTIEDFIEWIKEQTGREIIMIPWSMPPDMFGAWLSDDTEPVEYIFYRDDVPPIHQVHIQLHELSHFLCGHPTYKISPQTLADTYRSYATADENENVLPFNALTLLRSPKAAEWEIEAETLASLIQRQVIHYRTIDQLTRRISSNDRVAGHLNRLGLL